MLCFVVVMQSFIMNSHEVFIHIHQGCFAGTGAIVRLPQCQWSKPDGYGKISQCITTTKHSKAKTVCIFLGIYCIWHLWHDCTMSIINMSAYKLLGCTYISHQESFFKFLKTADLKIVQSCDTLTEETNTNWSKIGYYHYHCDARGLISMIGM